MRSGFLPVTDRGLLAWSAHFTATLSSDPERFGATTEDAEQFALVHAAFEAAMQGVVPEIRSRVTVNIKDHARATLEREARRLNALVRGSGVASNTALTELGLTVYKTSYRRIGPPTEAPTVVVRSVGPVGIELQLFQAGMSNRRLPRDVAGAVVFYWIGDDISPDPSRWPVAAHVSRARLTVPIHAPIGTKVSFFAYYLNRRGARGPLGKPTSTHALGGMMLGRNLRAA